ncbi:MAG TPA: hypothetical protein VM755_15985 [Stellaceae bacterium]|nr:hypothetical protein [Stellaceae bacterium]
MAAWRGDPEYIEAYDAREDEFALAAALIGARACGRRPSGSQSAKNSGLIA